MSPTPARRLRPLQPTYSLSPALLLRHLVLSSLMISHVPSTGSSFYGTSRLPSWLLLGGLGQGRGHRLGAHWRRGPRGLEEGWVVGLAGPLDDLELMVKVCSRALVLMEEPTRAIQVPMAPRVRVTHLKSLPPLLFWGILKDQIRNTRRVEQEREPEQRKRADARAVAGSAQPGAHGQVHGAAAARAPSSLQARGARGRRVQGLT